MKKKENDSNSIELEELIPTEVTVPNLEAISHRKIFYDLFHSIVTTFPGRVLSVGGYYIAVQLFGRQSKENLLIIAYLSIINYTANVLREALRNNGNDMRTAKNSGDNNAIRRSLRKAFINAVIAAVLIVSLTQSYTISLPAFNSPSVVIEALKFYPLKNSVNSLLLTSLTAVTNVGFALGDQFMLMLLYAIAGISVLSSYVGIHFFEHSISGLIMANTIQMTVFIVSYGFYFMRKRPELRLLTTLTTLAEIKNIFKESLKLMAKGLLPASIIAAEVIANILMVWTMRNEPIQIAALQAVQLVIILWAAVNSSFEQLTTLQIMTFNNMFIANPTALKTTLKRLCFHASWMGIAFEGAFFVLTFFKTTSTFIINFLVANKKDNEAIRELLPTNLALASFIPILHLVRCIFRAIILASANSDNQLHQQINRLSTFYNFIAPFLTVGAGYFLNAYLGYGFSSSYLLAMNITYGVSAITQVYLANWKVKADTVVEKNLTALDVAEPTPAISVPTPSWTSFFKDKVVNSMNSAYNYCTSFFS